MRIKPGSWTTLALTTALLASAPACKKKDGGAPPPAADKAAAGSADKAPPAKAGPKPPTAEAFGKAIAPTGLIAKLKIGMTEAEAKAVAPEFWDAQGGEQLVDSDMVDLHYSISFVDGRLNTVGYSNLGDADLRPLLAQAWGPGVDYKDEIDYPQIAWFDAASGWRAIAEGKASGGLTFTQYLSVDKLLGADPVQLAAFPKPILGATADDLRRDYPTMFKLETGADRAATAAKVAAEAKALGVDDVDKVLAPTSSDDSISMYLPPTEWGSMYTAVSPMFGDDKKVAYYFFTIPDLGNPATNAANLALFTKKWGAPKVKHTYKDKYVFHAKEPFIQIERDASDKGWEIRVSAKVDD